MTRPAGIADTQCFAGTGKCHSGVLAAARALAQGRPVLLQTASLYWWLSIAGGQVTSIHLAVSCHSCPCSSHTTLIWSQLGAGSSQIAAHGLHAFQSSLTQYQCTAGEAVCCEITNCPLAAPMRLLTSRKAQQKPFCLVDRRPPGKLPVHTAQAHLYA